ncbi:kinase-like domain-containing protein [Mycena olivaceomarginata]|nr:kinase-like domain-containing protein [Mycena olivaceomarginata]
MSTDSTNLSGRLQETQWSRRATRRILSKTETDRRTTLNTRFVHLASLLPSLAEVRRPSKAAIVESSIAYVHSAREHRTLASRELRALHIENQSLRREVNEWRARAGLDATVEPRRSDSFVLVLTGDMPEIHSDRREPKEHTDDMSPPSEAIDQRSSLQSPLTAASNFWLPDDSPRNSISRESSPRSVGDSMDWTNTIAPQTVAYHNTSQSSLDGLSAAESGESVNSSFSSSSRAEWNLPSYHVLAHRLILQELDLTGTVTRLDTYPVGSGGSADIYGGILGMSHWQSTPLPRRQVAIKIYRRLHSEPQELEQTSKMLYEATRSWSRLHHPNVLQFLGVSLDLGLSPALITPLCSSGPAMKYVKASTKNPTERLQMTIGVAEGLNYLHSHGIIHGNLSTKKVLINENGSPVLSGYGMFNIVGASPNTAAVFSSPVRFAAPEYFSDDTGTSSTRTMAGDVYAFSMVTLEILSELEPYHHLPTEHAVFKHILQGGRPIRTHLDYQVVTKRIWRFLTSLWHQDPSCRPRMGDVFSTLTNIDLREDENMGNDDSEPGSPEITSPKAEEKKLSSGEEATFEETSPVGFHGRDLNGRIKQDDQYPFAAGGNSNIYRGKLTRSDGRKIRVAIKMIRMLDDGSGQQEEMLRRLKREVDVWSRLKHKNILTFIGVCEDLAPLPVLISPYYKFGHVGKYISKHPGINRHELAVGVASGLKFLHENDVVHGDLKVQNVLVDKHGTPCICDFGISKVVSRRGFTTTAVGRAPYMAPELFFVVDGPDMSPQTSSSPRTTTRSDVYSFALLVLEILTAEPPKARPSRPIVTAKILADLRPKREDYEERMVPQRIWFILERCWAFEPLLRPAISQVLRDLADDNVVLSPGYG